MLHTSCLPWKRTNKKREEAVGPTVGRSVAFPSHTHFAWCYWSRAPPPRDKLRVLKWHNASTFSYLELPLDVYLFDAWDLHAPPPLGGIFQNPTLRRRLLKRPAPRTIPQIWSQVQKPGQERLPGNLGICCLKVRIVLFSCYTISVHWICSKWVDLFLFRIYLRLHFIIIMQLLLGQCTCLQI